MFLQVTTRYVKDSFLLRKRGDVGSHKLSLGTTRSNFQNLVLRKATDSVCDNIHLLY